MKLTRLVAPTVRPVSLVELKSHSRISHSDEDSYLEHLIEAATRHAERVTERQLCSATWRLTIDTFPVLSLPLPRPPLVSIASVEYRADTGSFVTLAPSAYVVDTEDTPGSIRPVWDTSWPDTSDEPGSVKVTYVAGYGGASDVPATIRQAILMTAAHWYEHREAVSETTLSPVPMAVDTLLGMERWHVYGGLL